MQFDISKTLSLLVGGLTKPAETWAACLGENRPWRGGLISLAGAIVSLVFLYRILPLALTLVLPPGLGPEPGQELGYDRFSPLAGQVSRATLTSEDGGEIETPAGTFSTIVWKLRGGSPENDIYVTYGEIPSRPDRRAGPAVEDSRGRYLRHPVRAPSCHVRSHYASGSGGMATYDLFLMERQIVSAHPVVAGVTGES